VITSQSIEEGELLFRKFINVISSNNLNQTFLTQGEIYCFSMIKHGSEFLFKLLENMSTKVLYILFSFKLLENMSTKVFFILFSFKLLENMSTKVLSILFSPEIIPPPPPSFIIFNPDKLKREKNLPVAVLFLPSLPPYPIFPYSAKYMPMKEYSTECNIKTQLS